MITLRNIYKSYGEGLLKVDILKDINLEILDGEKVAIVGPSGSGKTTLLSIMSGLDVPNAGEVIMGGENISKFSEKKLAEFRNKKISIVFQSFELVQAFTALENVTLPLAIRNDFNFKKGERFLNDVGLENKHNSLPRELSGGEQQRVAIARALASDSEIIFADEPTGNLDTVNGAKVLDIFLSSLKEKNKTFIIITHDMKIAEKMDRIIKIEAGQIVSDKK